MCYTQVKWSLELIKRPENLEINDVAIEFNFQNFEYLEIDLLHVNKDGRSSFSKEEVTKISCFLINNLNLVPSGEKDFGGETCSYFVRSGEYESKNYKLVFCICSDRPTTIGVITLHRV
jgi:hypothetical protein